MVLNGGPVGLPRAIPGLASLALFGLGLVGVWGLCGAKRADIGLSSTIQTSHFIGERQLLR